jgi:hypothetical protein
VIEQGEKEACDRVRIKASIYSYVSWYRERPIQPTNTEYVLDRVSALVEQAGAQSIVGANGRSKSRGSRQEAQSGNGGRRELHDDEYGRLYSDDDDDDDDDERKKLCEMERID